MSHKGIIYVKSKKYKNASEDWWVKWQLSANLRRISLITESIS